MINALFSSRDGGTKYFEYGGGTFGWKTIEKMYGRECSRRANGLARMVPKLKESKLNVHPAKIMQVCVTPLCMLKKCICMHYFLVYF